MKNFLLLFVFTSFILTASSQSSPSVFEMNERLGRGINMGNTFEAPSETAWGNPWKPEYFERIAALGFNHVRIPVSWELESRSLPNAPYTINETFKTRIVEVVDKALAEGLMVILNMHHHNEFMSDPVGQRDRFLALWEQIADLFEGYPDELLFEVLNEPTDALTPELWNVRFAEGLSVIRQKHPNRPVLMGVAEFGGLGAVPKMVFPDDDNIIISVHYYNPFHFTHQGAEWTGGEADTWLGTKWNDTQGERDAVINEFAQAIAIANENNIPINIGEFGAYNKADMDSRARWTTFLARWFEQQGFSWTYWEFSAGFGIFNPATNAYHQKLVDALLHNEMPEAAAVNKVLIYQSDFSNGFDGWSLSTFALAEGLLTSNDGKLTVNITTPSAEGWHAQLTHFDIPLQANQSYELTIKGSSVQNRTANLYIGKNSEPWNAYSDYYHPLFATTEGVFTYSFKMGNISDAASRISLDIGNQIGDIVLSSVRLEHVTMVGVQQLINSLSVKIWHERASNVIAFSSNQLVKKVEMYDLSGRLQATQFPNSKQSQISVSGLTSGLYLVKFYLDNNNVEVRKTLIQ